MRDDRTSRNFNALRWVSAVPCAYLVSWLAQGLGHGLFSLFRGSGYPEFLSPLLQYLPSGLVLIFVGAKIVPRRQIEVAVILAAVSMYLSRKIHVLGQLTPGLVNYMHATGESIGLLVGVALIFHRVRQSKPETSPDSPADSAEGLPS